MVAGKSSQQLRTVRRSGRWRFEVSRPYFFDPFCGVRLYAMGTVAAVGRYCFEVSLSLKEGHAAARRGSSSGRTRWHPLGSQWRLNTRASHQTRSCGCEDGEPTSETEPCTRGFAIERDRYEIIRCVTCSRGGAR